MCCERIRPSSQGYKINVAPLCERLCAPWVESTRKVTWEQIQEKMGEKKEKLYVRLFCMLHTYRTQLAKRMKFRAVSFAIFFVLFGNILCTQGRKSQQKKAEKENGTERKEKKKTIWSRVTFSPCNVKSSPPMEHLQHNANGKIG